MTEEKMLMNNIQQYLPLRPAHVFDLTSQKF